jgi:release factor glutamine methyltransferase
VPDASLVARLRAAGCVYAEDEARLLTEATADPEALETLVARRVAGEPLEHLLGWAQFDGLRVVLATGVFVPRPRTELLLDEAVRRLPEHPPIAVDLCCGSGAVGLAMLRRRPGLELHAADLDPVAVACARVNLEPVGGHVYEGDLTDALPERVRGRVDVLVANVPYVPTGELAAMPAEARHHEPALALDGGADGLDVLRRLADQAPWWLADGGWLLVETSRAQAEVAAEVLTRAGLRPEVTGRHEVRIVAGRGRVEG